MPSVAEPPRTRRSGTRHRNGSRFERNPLHHGAPEDRHELRLPGRMILRGDRPGFGHQPCLTNGHSCRLASAARGRCDGCARRGQGGLWKIRLLGGADPCWRFMRGLDCRDFLEMGKRAEAGWSGIARAAARRGGEGESGGGEGRQNADHGDSDGILGTIGPHLSGAGCETSGLRDRA